MAGGRQENDRGETTCFELGDSGMNDEDTSSCAWGDCHAVDDEETLTEKGQNYAKKTSKVPAQEKKVKTVVLMITGHMNGPWSTCP